jgi:hypothetical protein
MKYSRETMEILYDMNFQEREYCTEEENEVYKNLGKNGHPLPDNIYPSMDDKGGFYRFDNNFKSEDDLHLMIQLKKLKYIKSIAFGVTFFVVVTIIGWFLMLASGF